MNDRSTLFTLFFSDYIHKALCTEQLCVPQDVIRDPIDESCFEMTKASDWVSVVRSKVIIN
jgi:hypothetical protein